ncbi:MAG TPA: hypothetical protein VJQ09_06455 [Candidatus Limnocylindria bacterium]|nr:hypothetical protein [Candidatus Limnocylindria bacterium]
MAKRHRSRQRMRRSAEQAHRAPIVRADREASTGPRSNTHRPQRFSRTGYSRAAGAPSASLERGAVLEGGFIVKDFRRLGVVVAVALALLVFAGVMESVVIK